MDLKALMQKLEVIDKKQNLMEAEKKETTWTDKSGKKHPATQVKGDKYTGKEAEKDDKKKTDEGIVFNSSIAQMLLREFGLEEAPDGMQAVGDDEGNTTITRPDGSTMVVGPDGKQIMPGSNPNLPQNKGAGNKISNWLQDKGQYQKPGGFQPAAAGGQAAPAPAPAASTGNLTTSDGKPVTDGSGNPIKTGAGDAAAAPAKPAAAPAKPAAAPAPAAGQAASPAKPPAPTGTQVQTDDDGNHMITTPDGKTMVVGPDGKPLPNGGKAQPAGQAASPAKPAEVPAGINPETGEKYTSVADAPLQLPPGAEPEAGMTVAGDKSKPAGGQAASPAKPAAAKPGFKVDPVGQSIANQLKMTTPDAIKLFQKNNGLTPDGQIGPQTTKALQAAAQKMGLTTTSGVGTSTAGAGRGGQGGPTATQMAQAPAAGGQAASPAKSANPKVAEIDAKLASLKKYPQMNAQIIARLEKEKVALGGTSATPDQQAFAKSLGGAMESVQYQDDLILARIKSAFRF
jgi:hypothetical protein